MRFGLDVAQHQLSWDEILERTRFAEEAGFDGAWVFDHFTALYADPDGPCLEGWTLLAGLAVAGEELGDVPLERGTEGGDPRPAEPPAAASRPATSSPSPRKTSWQPRSRKPGAALSTRSRPF